MILDGAIKVRELHSAGPVPNQGDHPTELEGTWSIDGTCTDPKLLNDGRREEMKCTRKHCVVVNPLTLKWVDKMKGDVCRSSLVCREIKKANV